MRSTLMKEIDKLAWLCIKDKRLLVARSKSNDTYYIPGGKREAGESDHNALIREIKEELTVDLIPATIKPAGIFTAQAHGKPVGQLVKMTCYQAEFTGEILADSEIEEVQWFNFDDKARCSLVTQIIMDQLKLEGLIASSSLIHQEPLKDISLEEESIIVPSMMKAYEWILFDADETLFDFDAFKGLQCMFSRLSILFTQEDYLEYQALNKPLWVQYQRGTITALQVQHGRFSAWAEKLSIPAGELNRLFLDAMADICTPLDGAISLLSSLRGKAKLGIITNGFTQLQQIRLERTGLSEHFELLVISEQVGIAKPDRRIFDHAFSIMGNPALESILMVGDNLETDILGGINAGVDTCWLNAHKKSSSEHIKPRHEVASLVELEHLLLGRRLLTSVSFDESRSKTRREGEAVALSSQAEECEMKACKSGSSIFSMWRPSTASISIAPSDESPRFKG